MLLPETVLEMVMIIFTVIFVATGAIVAAIVAGVAVACFTGVHICWRHVPRKIEPRNPTDDELNEIRKQITELKSDVSRANLAVGLRVRE